MPTDKKISQLPVSTGINTSDIGVLVDADTTQQFSFSQLLTYLAANLPVGAIFTFGLAAIPSNTVGKNGDVYVKTDTGQFVQKISGAWTVVYTIVPGVVGSTIYYGSAAPGSGIGINGDTYVQTVGGIFSKKIAGVWTAQFTMATGPVGPAGANGANGTNGTNGNTVLNGTTNPSNSLTGVNGDFYINTTTWNIFGPKAAGVWPNGIAFTASYAPSLRLSYAKGVPNPIFISDWQSALAAVYSNDPTIIIQTVITGAILGVLLSGGSGYIDGTYEQVPLNGGTGSGALATVGIAGGIVTNLVITDPGKGYTALDTLSANNSDIGGDPVSGPPGSGLVVTVETLGIKYIDTGWMTSRLESTTGALQQLSFSDPDPSDSTITAEALRIIIKL